MKKYVLLFVYSVITIIGLNAQVTVSSQVSSSAADAQEILNTGIVNLTNTSLKFDDISVGFLVGGIHFTGLAIPEGAIIDSAYVEIFPDYYDPNSTEMVMRFYAEMADSPQIWVSTNQNITNRLKTDNFVQFSSNDWIISLVGSDYMVRSADLSSVIQEVVNGSNYQSQDPINLIATRVSGGNYSTFFTYDGNPAKAAKLYVTYIVDSQAPDAPVLVSSSSSETSIDLSWSTPSDNGTITGYKVYKDGVLETTLGNVLSYQVTGLTANTSYVFTVTALDAAGNESTYSNTVTTTNASVSIRVNVGGAQTTYGGNNFMTDQYSTGGTPYNSSNTSLDLLYRSERYGNFSYAIPVTNGSYDVVLHFMEIFMTAPGQRIFDVKIEGNLVMNNYDIYQDVGVAATTKTFYNVQVNDGVLNLVFTNIGSGGETGNPKLSGFEILSIQGPTPPILSMTSKTDTTVDLSWTASTDNGVVGYKVYKNGVLELTLGNVLSYQVTGLTAETAYDFTITAFDAQNNESLASNIASVTTNVSSGGGGGYWSLNNQDISYTNGNVGIGTSTPDSKLTVKGSIHSEEVKVNLSVPAPDYVFKADYNLVSLKKLQEYIITHGHLPNIPSAKEMEAHGIELGIMNMKLLEKIEELTLYILIQEDRIKVLEENINSKK